MPPELDTALRIFGVLSLLAVGIFAWFYFRQMGGQAAQQRLNSVNKDTISALESRIKLLLLVITDLEKQLSRMARSLQKSQESLAKLIEDQDLIG